MIKLFNPEWNRPEKIWLSRHCPLFGSAGKNSRLLPHVNLSDDGVHSRIKADLTQEKKQAGNPGSCE
jgi:hypothetical protein